MIESEMIRFIGGLFIGAAMGYTLRVRDDLSGFLGLSLLAVLTFTFAKNGISGIETIIDTIAITITEHTFIASGWILGLFGGISVRESNPPRN